MFVKRGTKVLFINEDGTEAVGILGSSEQWRNGEYIVEAEYECYVYTPGEDSFVTIKGRNVKEIINRKKFDEFLKLHNGMNDKEIRWWLLGTFDRLGMSND